MTENSTQPADRKYDDLFKVKKKTLFRTRKRKFKFVQYLYRYSS